MSKLDTSKTEWDLSPLLKSDDDPRAKDYRKTIEKATKEFVDKWRGRSDYLTEPAALAKAIAEIEEREKLPGNGNEEYYFGLRTSQDSIDPKLKAKENQVEEFSKSIGTQLQFFWLNVGGIDPKLQPKFLAAKELQQYTHALEKLFAQAKYRLSEPEEKIMMLKSSVAYANWVRMTETFLSKEEREVKGEDGKKSTATLETMLTLSRSQQKAVRDDAGKALDNIFASYAEVAETELNSILANKKIDDDLRGYERPDSSRHLGTDIDTEVVDALVKAVSGHNKIAQDFYKLKAQLIGLPKLRYHERGVEYGKIDRFYTYDQACELAHSVFEELDPEFADIFAAFLAEGRVDVYPRKGKRGGAFCTYHHITHPVYVMLNFTGKLQDVTTLAHEMGHGINDELTKKAQNAINFGTSLATAEVASTFMEDFMVERIAADADDELKLALLVSQVGDQVQTIFRQIACYRFEQELHAKFREAGYVSAEEINKLFRKHMAAYMGEAAEGCENWWVYWSHIRNFFYVYSYASGLLISKALQAKVRADKKFIEKVKVFLSAGVSKSPKDIFGDMGINIADPKFWQEGVAEIGRQLEETKALAKKLGKI